MKPGINNNKIPGSSVIWKLKINITEYVTAF